MKKNIILLAIVVFFVTVTILMLIEGTESLNKNGSAVHETTTDKAKNCQFLMSVVASEDNGWGAINANIQGALNKIRNQAAEHNGNSFVIKEINSSAWYILVRAEVYKCE